MEWLSGLCGELSGEAGPPQWSLYEALWSVAEFLALWIVPLVYLVVAFLAGAYFYHRIFER